MEWSFVEWILEDPLKAEIHRQKIHSKKQSLLVLQQDLQVEPEKKMWRMETWDLTLFNMDPKTNIGPKNGGFQQESPFPGVYFHVLC